MNRRKFLQSIAAIPLVGPAAAMAGKITGPPIFADGEIVPKAYTVISHKQNALLIEDDADRHVYAFSEKSRGFVMVYSTNPIFRVVAQMRILSKNHANRH